MKRMTKRGTALGKLHDSTHFQAIVDCVVAGATSEQIRKAVTEHCDAAIVEGLREKRRLENG